jgi:hypothetical protein
MDEVRAIRDDIERRVVEFIDTRLDDIRADRTATSCASAGCCPTSTASSQPRTRPSRSATAYAKTAARRWTRPACAI